MNSRGIMFTLMALILILGIIAFNESEMGNWAFESESTKVSDISSVKNKYSNIAETVTTLHPNGVRKEIGERNLPFEYYWEEDSNSIEIKQNIPLNTVDLENYFNFLNVYRQYLLDTEYENAFNGLRIDVNTLQNAPWGGTSEEFQFLLKPFCYQYRANGEEEMIMEASGSQKCSAAFSSNSIARLDINVMIRYSDEDFNIVECNGEACPQDAFNPLSTDPYYKIEIIDENCVSCSISQKVISEHFSWAADKNIIIYNNGGSPESAPVNISFGNDVNVSRHGDKSIEIRIKTEFTEKIDSFEFLDFNFTVYSRDGKSRKSNNPEAIQ